jgi:geranylgeranyl reductase family protein
MIHSRYDVIVVGAGPSGSAAARAVAQAGLRVLCIEEHATIGYPVQCAGLLSNNAFDECNVTDASLLHSVSGATITAGLSSFSFDAKKTKAIIVDRGAMDREMAIDAASDGASYLPKSYVSAINPTRKVITARGPEGGLELGYRVLIAADGPRSGIARQLGIERAPMYLSGVQCEILWDGDEEKVNVYPNASPDFFGWVIPIGDGRARIGLCGLSDVKDRFSSFYSMITEKSNTTSMHQFVAGTIPIGIMPKTYGQGVMFVGDAAGFAKPTSGGGVYTGVRSARHAAATAIEACEQDSSSDAVLKRYEKRWDSDFGKELRFGMRCMNVRRQMSPQDLERIVHIMNDPEIASIIVKYGDMDRPQEVVSRLALQPKMYQCLLPCMKAGIKSLIPFYPKVP